ncbi:hypothetical protein PI125_g23226 [Phytophthora idaei]|nr:hypothetical protein PI125_g23226 [Phytophthora idaei]
MDLSYAEGEEVELLAAEQRTSIRRCFMCGSTRHLRRELPSAQPVRGSAEPSLWLVAGKRRLPVGAGRPTGEELSSVRPPGGREQQDPAPKRAGLSYKKSVCKPGLLVVQANVKGFEKPWRVLINSGASGNYARRSTRCNGPTLCPLLRLTR